MKILHTSDWHIGRRLHEHDRLNETRKFFSWLIDLIIVEKIDILLVSGDIFDNITPSNEAKKIYYSFLGEIAKTSCRHTIITSGNHDSPSLIDAPSDLLNVLNIKVVGQAYENPEDEVFLLKNKNNEPEAIICAVPFLHDRDVRSVSADENFQDRQVNLIHGIYLHYEKVFSKVEKLRENLKIPVIAMGHLFVTGSKVSEGEEMKELYVGTLIRVGVDIFPEKLINYVALGHLHSAQSVNGKKWIRYSGSPIAMSFGETDSQKSVCIIDFDEDNNAIIKKIPVPVFRILKKVRGNWNEITRNLNELALLGDEVWLEIFYNGEEIFDLKDKIKNFLKNIPLLEVLSIHDETKAKFMASQEFNFNEMPGLDEISPLEIFERKIKANNVPEERKKILRAMYHEILEEINQNENS